MGSRGKSLRDYLNQVDADPAEFAGRFKTGFLVGCRSETSADAERVKTAEIPLDQFDEVTELMPEGSGTDVLPISSDSESYYAFALQPQTWKDGTCCIGRSPDCDLIILDGSVSRRHANLECDFQGRVVVSDLQSTNGTFVASVPVHQGESKVVDPGKTVQFGDTSFTLMPAEQFIDFVRAMTAL